MALRHECKTLPKDCLPISCNPCYKLKDMEFHNVFTIFGNKYRNEFLYFQCNNCKKIFRIATSYYKKKRKKHG